MVSENAQEVVMADITCKQIFEEMPKHFDPEAAGDWAATVQFKISGEGGGNWVLTVKDKQCETKEGEAENPTATVETDAETWVGISTGEVNGQQAFFSGKLRIQGNMSDVMKMQQVIKRPSS